jgi:hypothetical protein
LLGFCVFSKNTKMFKRAQNATIWMQDCVFVRICSLFENSKNMQELKHCGWFPVSFRSKSRYVCVEFRKYSKPQKTVPASPLSHWGQLVLCCMCFQTTNNNMKHVLKHTQCVWIQPGTWCPSSPEGGFQIQILCLRIPPPYWPPIRSSNLAGYLAILWVCDPASNHNHRPIANLLCQNCNKILKLGTCAIMPLVITTGFGYGYSQVVNQ